jgi:hypothetical protein
MRLSFYCMLIFISLEAGAQSTVDVTSGNVNAMNFLRVVGGQPVTTPKFTKLVEGTPYFKDEWMKGSVILNGGSEHKNVSLKLDLFNNELHFLNETGEEYIANNDVKEVVLNNATGTTNYRFVHSSVFSNVIGKKDGWYLCLHTGNASLYKYFQKSLTEDKPYNSATVEQMIQTKERYMVLYNSTFLELKNIKDAPNVLANKKTELQEFIKSKDKKEGPLDGRMTSLIAYYNTLLTSQ